MFPRYEKVLLLGLLALAVLLGVPGILQATVVTEVLYHLGEDGANGGAALLPKDSSDNNRDAVASWGGNTTSIVSGGPSYWPTSTSYYHFGGGIGYGATYTAPTDNVGVEVWARVSPTAGSMALFGTGWWSNHYWNGYSHGLDIVFDGGKFKGTVGTGSGAENFAEVGAGYTPSSSSEWVHLALVRDSGVTTFYVNGVASGVTSSATPVSDDWCAMSIAPGGSGMFTGDMDEARVFTFAPGAFSTSDLQIAEPPPTWQGTLATDGKYLWSTAGNWSPSGAPAPTQAPIFGDASSTNTTVTLDANQTVSGLEFRGDKGTTIEQSQGGANTLTLDKGTSDVIVTVAGQHAINVPMTLNSTAKITTVGTGDSLTLGNSVQSVASGVGIIKDGLGTLSLGGNVSLPGNLAVSGGTVQVSGTLASGGGNVSVANGGTLNVSSTGSVQRNVSIASGGTATISGSMSGAALDVSSAGTTTFTSAQATLATLNVTAGTTTINDSGLSVGTAIFSSAANVPAPGALAVRQQYTAGALTISTSDTAKPVTLSGANLAVAPGTISLSGGTVTLSNLGTVAPSATGLIGYWNFDEGAGTVAHDTAAGVTQHNGTLDAATWAAGKIGSGSLYATGPGVAASMGSLGYTGNVACTMAAWVKTDYIPTSWNSLYGFVPGDSGTGFSLATDGGNNYYAHVSWAGTTIMPMDSGVWHHIVMTNDPSTGQLIAYADGVQMGTAGCGTLTDDFGVESWNAAWKGWVDDLRVYNRVLTPDEVAQLAAYRLSADMSATAIVTTQPTTVALDFGGQTTATLGAATLGADLSLSGTATTASFASLSATGSGTYTLGNAEGNTATVALRGSATVPAGAMVNVTAAIVNDAAPTAVAKLGDGTLILSGANTYSGTTTVSAGTLLVNGSLAAGAGNGGVSVIAGATLGGSGTIGRYVNVAGVLSPGAGVGKLTINNDLDMAAGSTLLWELGALADKDTTGSRGRDYDALDVVGTLGLGDESHVAVAGLTLSFGTGLGPDEGNGFWTSAHSWEVIALTGTNVDSLGFASITNGSYIAGTFGTSVDGSGNVWLNYTINGGVPTFSGSSKWTATTGSSWGAGANWTDTAPEHSNIHEAPGLGAQPEVAQFDAGATAGTATIALDDGDLVSPAAVNPTLKQIRFGGDTAYTIQRGGPSQTLGGLTLQGVSGGEAAIDVEAGAAAHEIAAPVALASDTTVTTADNAPPSDLTISGPIDGDGTLTKAGAGTLVLSGTNNYASTAVTGGTLIIASAGALPAGKSLSIGSGGTLILGGELAMGQAASAEPVPEPGTLALLAIAALTGVMIWRRRK